MPKAELIDYPVANLPDRYSKARSVVYGRMDKLGIKPYKIGRKAFIKTSDLERLDRLDTFLSEDTARDVSDFLSVTKQNAQIQSLSRSQSGKLATQNVVTSELSYLSLNAQDVSYLLMIRFELLERASRNRWILSTSDLAALCRIAPATLTKRDRFLSWGFHFEKCSDRCGREVGWRVRSPKRG